MKIVSYNINGIRAALKKGFLDWLSEAAPDVLCVQEVKALQTDIDLSLFEALGYHCHWFSADKKGYSGVATLVRDPSCAAYGGTGHSQSDAEGRVLRTDLGPLTIINAYFPSGTTGSARQDYKHVWLREFGEWIQHLRASRPQLIVCGDFNIAHTEKDIHNPKGNAKNSGFLPEERAWMDVFLGSGMVDIFRPLSPDVRDSYSWWSQRFPTVRTENKGWRIDYICASENLLPRLQTAGHLREVTFSDHCPVLAELSPAG